MKLRPLLLRYEQQFYRKYGNKISVDQRKALASMIACRTDALGEFTLHCQPCDKTVKAYQSCGHRACPACQHHDTSRWLARQQEKLLPAKYFLITFTLPAQWRAVAMANRKGVFNALLKAASATIMSFVEKDPKLGGKTGFSAVLHTHSRRLDFHPHVHIVVPAGSFDQKRWRSKSGDYLFNEDNLANVFRAKFIDLMNKAALPFPTQCNKNWIADCTPVGSGLSALKYLSRYLYKGVIAERNIIQDDGEAVTFAYKDSQTKQRKTRTLPGEDFIFLLLQHVLPKRFRRSRDYGLNQSKAKSLLVRIQQMLRYVVAPLVVTRPKFVCPCCKGPMDIIAFTPRALRFKYG